MSEVHRVSACSCVAEEFAPFSAATSPQPSARACSSCSKTSFCSDHDSEEPDDYMRGFPKLRFGLILKGRDTSVQLSWRVTDLTVTGRKDQD